MLFLRIFWLFFVADFPLFRRYFSNFVIKLAHLHRKRTNSIGTRFVTPWLVSSHEPQHTHHALPTVRHWEWTFFFGAVVCGIHNNNRTQCSIINSQNCHAKLFNISKYKRLFIIRIDAVHGSFWDGIFFLSRYIPRITLYCAIFLTRR